MIRPILFFILLVLVVGNFAQLFKRLTPNQREMLSTGAIFWFIITTVVAALVAAIVTFF